MSVDSMAAVVGKALNRPLGKPAPCGRLRRTGLSRLALLALAGTALSFPTAGSAVAGVILSGDYLKIGVNDKGALGSGGSVSPGILYDGTGTGTFNTAYDYLTPGSPFEGFTFTGAAGASFSATNNNANVAGAAISGVLTDYSGVAHDGATYDQRAVWVGTYAVASVNLFTVTHDYYFDVDGQQLNIKTTIEALANLTDLGFARFTDPDAVAAPGDSSATNNFRGATGVPVGDLVYAEATVSKYVIGLYTNDPTTHNSGVTGWTTDPATYLTGTDVGDGDNTIGLGFDLGDLASGGKITLNYRYIFGTDIAAAVVASNGGGAPAPAPTPPPTPNIDTTVPYTVDQLASGQVKPVFDGGVLTLGSSGAVSTDFTILPTGGAIDTAGHDLVLSGSLSGGGSLTKAGPGVLTLTGDNSFNGVKVGGGVLEFNSAAALGSTGGAIVLNGGGTLRPTSSLAIPHALEIGGAGRLEVASELTLAGPVTGDTLMKSGSGVLTLNGVNAYKTLEIEQGLVLANGARTLGAANGAIVLHKDAGLALGGDMTISQTVEIRGDNARFDTGAHTVTLSGALSGTNCFVKAGQGHLNLVAAGSNAIGACVEEGQLSFNNVFTGNVWVDSGAAVAGSGRINGNLLVEGALSPGNSPGRLVVAGSVTQTASSNLVLDIDGPTPGIGAGHYDTVVLTGAGSRYTAAGTISPITRGITGEATNSYTPRIGDAFQVVTAEGGVTGAFAQVVQPAQGMPDNARFEVLYTSNAVILAVTPESYARLVSAAAPINAQALAAAVDSQRTAGAVGGGSASGSASNAFTLGLVALDNAQIGAVLHRAAGEAHADGLDTVLESSRLTRGQVSARIDQGFEPGRRVWGEISGDRWKVQSDARAGGYSADRAAITFGVDHLLSSNLLVGAAVSYGETELDAGVMGQAESTSYQGLAYAGWRSGAYYVNGVLAAGIDHYKTTRTIELSTGRYALSAKPEGVSLAADLEAGRRLSMGPATLVLAVGLGSDRVERDALVEQGGAAAALRFDDATRQALQGRVGGRIGGQARVGALTLTPQASVFVRRELDDVATRLDAQLHGADFAVSAASPGRTSVELTSGVDATLNERVRLGVGYRFGQSDGAESHALRASASIRW